MTYSCQKVTDKMGACLKKQHASSRSAFLPAFRDPVVNGGNYNGSGGFVYEENGFRCRVSYSCRGKTAGQHEKGSIRSLRIWNVDGRPDV